MVDKTRQHVANVLHLATIVELDCCVAALEVVVLDMIATAATNHDAGLDLQYSGQYACFSFRFPITSLILV